MTTVNVNVPSIETAGNYDSLVAFYTAYNGGKLDAYYEGMGISTKAEYTAWGQWMEDIMLREKAMPAWFQSQIENYKDALQYATEVAFPLFGVAEVAMPAPSMPTPAVIEEQPIEPVVEIENTAKQFEKIISDNFELIMEGNFQHENLEELLQFGRTQMGLGDDFGKPKEVVAPVKAVAPVAPVAAPVQTPVAVVEEKPVITAAVQVKEIVAPVAVAKPAVAETPKGTVWNKKEKVTKANVLLEKASNMTDKDWKNYQKQNAGLINARRKELAAPAVKVEQPVIAPVAAIETQQVVTTAAEPIVTPPVAQAPAPAPVEVPVVQAVPAPVAEPVASKVVKMEPKPKATVVAEGLAGLKKVEVDSTTQKNIENNVMQRNQVREAAKGSFLSRLQKSRVSELRKNIAIDPLQILPVGFKSFAKYVNAEFFVVILNRDARFDMEFADESLNTYDANGRIKGFSPTFGYLVNHIENDAFQESPKYDFPQHVLFNPHGFFNETGLVKDGKVRPLNKAIDIVMFEKNTSYPGFESATMAVGKLSPQEFKRGTDVHKVYGFNGLAQKNYIEQVFVEITTQAVIPNEFEQIGIYKDGRRVFGFKG